MYDLVNNHSECSLCLPDIANSSKGCLHLSRFSSAIISSIKNNVLDPAKRLPIFSIQPYKILPGSIKMTYFKISPNPFSTPVGFFVF